jgi:uncharacterized protein (TIGR00251 family)
MTGCIQPAGDSLLLSVKVTPGASKSALLDVREGRLRIKIAAAPEDGKANNELVAFLARKLGCARRDIAIESGEKSRQKTLRLSAACREKLEACIAPATMENGK